MSQARLGQLPVIGHGPLGSHLPIHRLSRIVPAHAFKRPCFPIVRPVLPMTAGTVPRERVKGFNRVFPNALLIVEPSQPPQRVSLDSRTVRRTIGLLISPRGLLNRTFPFGPYAAQPLDPGLFIHV